MTLYEAIFKVKIFNLSLSVDTVYVVGSILEVDVQLLKNEFVNGYRKADRVLYVFHMKKGSTMNVQIAKTLGEHWQSSNKLFEEIFNNNKHYERFCDKIVLFRRVIIGLQLGAAILVGSTGKM